VLDTEIGRLRPRSMRKFERRVPGRTRPGPVLEAHDLARTLGVPVGDLQEIAQQTRVPFSMSTLVGLWIRRADLPAWHQAAQRWRSR
jgi:hypothetical protein